MTTTASMITGSPGMPVLLSTATNGPATSSGASHGRTSTMIATEPT